MNQGIVYLTRNGTFCLVFVTLKFFKELFYPTENGITASVSFVSLTLIVLNAK